MDNIFFSLFPLNHEEGLLKMLLMMIVVMKYLEAKQKKNTQPSVFSNFSNLQK